MSRVWALDSVMSIAFSAAGGWGERQRMTHARRLDAPMELHRFDACQSVMPNDQLTVRSTASATMEADRKDPPAHWKNGRSWPLALPCRSKFAVGPLRVLKLPIALFGTCRSHPHAEQLTLAYIRTRPVPAAGQRQLPASQSRT